MPRKIDPVPQTIAQSWEPETKKERIIKCSIYAAVFILVPLIPGLCVYFILDYPLIFDSLFTGFGALSLLIVMFSDHSRDTKNVKKTHTIVEDTKSPQYQEWKFYQIYRSLIGIIDLIIGITCFACLK